MPAPPKNAAMHKKTAERVLALMSGMRVVDANTRPATNARSIDEVNFLAMKGSPESSQPNAAENNAPATASMTTIVVCISVSTVGSPLLYWWKLDKIVSTILKKGNWKEIVSRLAF
jgi:hypothetical protein